MLSSVATESSNLPVPQRLWVLVDIPEGRQTRGTDPPGGRALYATGPFSYTSVGAALQLIFGVPYRFAG